MTPTPKAEPMSDTMHSVLVSAIYERALADTEGAVLTMADRLNEWLVNAGYEITKRYAASQRPAVPEGVEKAFTVIEEYTHPMVKFEVQSILRAHIAAQGLEIERLRGALQFYADCKHFNEDDYYESVNEHGTVAKLALTPKQPAGGEHE